MVKLDVIYFQILQIYEDISSEVILYGKDNLSEEQNVNIFYALHDYINHSHHLD